MTPNDDYSEFSEEVTEEVTPQPSVNPGVHIVSSDFFANGTAWVGGWNMLPWADDEDNDE
jgi:hypothetical protein